MFILPHSVSKRLFQFANPRFEVKSQHACADEFLNNGNTGKSIKLGEIKDGGLIVIVVNILNNR